MPFVDQIKGSGRQLKKASTPHHDLLHVMLGSIYSTGVFGKGAVQGIMEVVEGGGARRGWVGEIIGLSSLRPLLQTVRHGTRTLSLPPGIPRLSGGPVLRPETGKRPAAPDRYLLLHRARQGTVAGNGRGRYGTVVIATRRAPEQHTSEGRILGSPFSVSMCFSIYVLLTSFAKICMT